MADLIVLAQSIPMKAAGGSSFYQDIKDAVDISAYDSIDFSINLVTSHVDGASIFILTSIQNQVDDLAASMSDPSWYSIGSISYTGAAGKPGYKSVSVPSSSAASPMLRYVRYMVTLGGGTSEISFSITGLARRGLRVG